MLRDAEEMGQVYKFLGLSVKAGVKRDTNEKINIKEEDKSYLIKNVEIIRELMLRLFTILSLVDAGYSSSNLWRMRNFYLSYKDNEKLAQLVREISWGQNILIFEKCKDDKIKEYYIKNSIEFGWNRNVLMHHIKTNLFDRDKKENKDFFHENIFSIK